MKAYRDSEGHVRLFRPDMNMDRLNRSSSRLGMPVGSIPLFPVEFLFT